MLTQYGVGMPGMNKDQYKVQLEVTQTIWDGGKSAADKRIAEAEAAEQRQATDVDLYALEGRVDDLYFGILLLDERVAQTKLTLGLLRSNLDKVRSLQRNGAAMQSDADAVEAELLTVEQQLAQVEASRESYRRMLELFHRRGAGRSGARAAGRRGARFVRGRTSRTGAVRRAGREARGAATAGEIGDPSPFRTLRAGILRVSGHGLLREHDGERLVVECARRIPDVVEFRGVLHEEEFGGQTPHGTAAARCAARRLPLQHTVADRRGRAATSPACAARWPTTTASCSCAVRCAKPQNRSSATG